MSSLEEQYQNYLDFKNGNQDYLLTEDGYSLINNSKQGFFEKVTGSVKDYATDTMETYKKAGDTILKYNQDIGTGIMRGGAKLIEGVGSLGLSTLEKLDLVGDGSVQEFGEFFKNNIYPNIGETETMAGGFAEGLTQYMTPGIGYYKLFGTLLQGRKIVGPIVRGLLAETATVGTAQVAGDPNMVGFFMDVFKVDKTQAETISQEFFNWLGTPEEDYNADAVFEEKIKAIIADSPMGPVGEFIAPALKLFGKVFKKGKNDPEIMEEFKSLSASATPEELKEGFKTTQPFYSNVVRAINNITIPEGGMDVTQFYNTIKNTPGVKQSELDDMKFDEFFLDDKPALVTQDQVDDFLERKDLTKKVTTTMLETNKNFENFKLEYPEFEEALSFTEVMEIVDRSPDESLAAEQFENWIKNNQDLPLVKEHEKLLKSKELNEGDRFFTGQYQSQKNNLIKYYIENELGLKRADVQDSIRPRYEGETLLGGEDYKEMLISSNGTAQVYTKGHYEQAGVVPKGENLLAHIRFNTRTINGKKTLFIEELQSDLHHRGRKEGYQKTQGELYELIKQKNSISEKRMNLINQGLDVGEDGVSITELADQAIKLDEQIKEMNVTKGVPDAPFKKTWHEMALKRIIKYAVDNDFEAVAITPGQIQADRYNLSKRIEKVSVKMNADGTINLQAKALNSTDRVNKNIKIEELENYVGKDLSKKMIDDLQSTKKVDHKKNAKKIKSLRKKLQVVKRKINSAIVRSDKKHYPHATRNLYYKKEGKDLTVYYSYQTPISYVYKGETVTRVNDWGPTTGRHMSWVSEDMPDDRIPGWRFEEKLNEVRAKKQKKITDEVELKGLLEEEKKLEKEFNALQKMSVNEYTGLDLKVGGEGLKTMYDQIFMKFLNKFAKKYNAKVTEGELEVMHPGKSGTDSPWTTEFEEMITPFLEITPEMKKEIMQEGVPIAEMKDREEEQQAVRMA